LKRFILASLIALAFIVGLALPALADSPEEFESYATGVDVDFPVYGPNWYAQTFTIDPASHSIYSVRLLLYREATPGTLTISIKATDGAGKPTGLDLASATIDGDTLSTSTSGVWYELVFDPPTSGDYDTVYAIVAKAPAATSTADCVDWRADGSSGSYAGGSKFASTDSGLSWTADTDDDFYFEVWGYSLISVDSAQVFTGFLETDDLLFVLNYQNTYTPYYPTDDPARYFDVQLTNSAGSTVLAQTVCRAWGNIPGSIYLSADTAASLTLGSAYRLYVYGVVDGDPNDYYHLTVADWRGDDLSYLDSYVITMAHTMAEYYDTPMTTFTGTNEVLNDEGAILFSIGIPGLQLVRPDLFLATAQIPEYNPQEWTDAFEGATDWETQVGPTVAGILTAGGDMFGIDGKGFGVFFLLGLYILIAAGAGANKVDATVIIALSFPILALGAWLRVIDIVIIAVIGAIAVFLFIYSLFWSRT